mgnify:CR=1 FL=1
MKQKIKNYLDYVLASKLRMLGLVIAMIGLVGYSAQNIFIDVDGQSASVIEGIVDNENNADISESDSNIAVVGSDASAPAISLGNSWPGEVISSAISHIQPQREGVITSWKVGIGDSVSAGDILGEISAPPATPELIAMLAEKTESLARANAGASVADVFASKEQLRFDALKNSIESNTYSGTTLSFGALDLMRKKVEIRRVAVRSFIERALSDHVLKLTNATSWRYIRYGSLNRQFGIYNPAVQNSYESALFKLVGQLKNSSDLPIEEAENYFTLIVQLANNSGDEELETEFKMSAADDQKEFLDMMADYRMAQAEVADKETEYKLMISENSAMVEKDKSMAHAEVKAMESSYETVAKEIRGGSYIVSPRAGTISAIYKKVGDLVGPEMSVAVVSGYGRNNLTVRMSIPNNVKRPAPGDILSIVRPGFSKDIYKAKIIGVGTTLNEAGSYMADAKIIDNADWSAGTSIRVLAPKDTDALTIKTSSVWWNQDGLPHVWGVTEAGRIFSKKITIGRTLGVAIEVLEGIKNGDRYVVHPTLDLREDMLMEDIVGMSSTQSLPEKSNGERKPMGGMEM